MDRLLRSLGLHRRELRAWVSYDWANSAFVTSVMGALLPIYYLNVSASGLPKATGTVYWGYTNGLALVLVACTAPFLGAAADYLGAKKKFLAAFAVIGSTGCLLLFFTSEGNWQFASAAFIVGNIGFASGNVFYESLLPHVARPEEIDRVSTSGYALGYVGGGLLLALHMAWASWPEVFGFADASEASRYAFLSVALWWMVFTLPILRGVTEPPVVRAAFETGALGPLRAAGSRVRRTFSEIRQYRQLFLFLLAFWFYNDGINTIIKMATAYGTEIGIGMTHLLGAFLMVQILGVPATFLYGGLAARIGAKNGIYLALVIYTGICVFGFFMSEPWHFWVLASALALVQGGSQALSRSLFAAMVPKARSSEFFGFYSVSGKFGNVIGPVVFAIVSSSMGGSRYAILALVSFFVIGFALLTTVDVDEGRQKALGANV